jgi:hypothetical protein
MMRLFEDFHPEKKPVLWRILITQAHLYRALVRTSDKDSNSFANPVEVFDIQERNDFDWRPSGSEATVEEAIEWPFSAARDYLAQRLERLEYVRGVKQE